jgi:hypothetical protein
MSEIKYKHAILGIVFYYQISIIDFLSRKINNVKMMGRYWDAQKG